MFDLIINSNIHYQFKVKAVISRMKPCDTPAAILSQEEAWPFRVSNCFLWNRKFTTVLRKKLGTLHCLRVYILSLFFVLCEKLSKKYCHQIQANVETCIPKDIWDDFQMYLRVFVDKWIQIFQMGVNSAPSESSI